MTLLRDLLTSQQPLVTVAPTATVRDAAKNYVKRLLIKFVVACQRVACGDMAFETVERRHEVASVIQPIL